MKFVVIVDYSGTGRGQEIRDRGLDVNMSLVVYIGIREKAM